MDILKSGAGRWTDIYLMSESFLQAEKVRKVWKKMKKFVSDRKLKKQWYMKIFHGGQDAWSHPPLPSDSECKNSNPSLW